VSYHVTVHVNCELPRYCTRELWATMLLYTWTVSYHVTVHVRLETTDELLFEYTQACLKTKISAEIIWPWNPNVAYFLPYAAAHLQSSQFWRKNVTVQNCPLPNSLNQKIYVIFNNKYRMYVRYTGRPLTQSDYTRSCINTIVLLRMSTELLETCRGFK